MAGITLPDLSDGELSLRPPAERDVERITEICRDDEVQRWTRVPSPYTEDDARSFVRTSAEALSAGRGIHLLAVDGDDDVLGAAGLDLDHRDLSGEIGYWVAPEARRRGVASRSCRLLLSFALAELDLGYIALWAAADNLGSNAVARTLGFSHEGTARQAMLIGPSGDPSAPRGDANLWGLRPGELT